jgi:hypothetical protein
MDMESSQEFVQILSGSSRLPHFAVCSILALSFRLESLIYYLKYCTEIESKIVHWRK